MAPRIALMSDHASPLAVLGGVDSGGQNVYVAQVARELAARGHEVDVFTRRDRSGQPRVVEWCRNVRVIHVPAGPATEVRKEDLLPYMVDFARWMIGFCRMRGGYDLLHANFFMSGVVARQVRLALGIPFVITFQALGRVRRKYQREADEFPVERAEIEEPLVSNQPGVGLGYFPLAALQAMSQRILQRVRADRADLHGFYYGPHAPAAPGHAACGGRKRAPGLLLRAAAEHGIALEASWFIGDILDDVEAGHRAACRGILVDNGNETDWLSSPLREPDHVAGGLVDAAAHVLNATQARREAGRTRAFAS